MPNKYLPNTDSDRVVWLNNFNNKLSRYATPLNIAAADVTQTGKDYAAYAYTINALDLLKQSQQNATAYKNVLIHAGGQLIGSIPAAPDLGLAPLPVQPSTKMMDSLPCRAMISSSACRSMPRSRMMLMP